MALLDFTQQDIQRLRRAMNWCESQYGSVRGHMGHRRTSYTTATEMPAYAVRNASLQNLGTSGVLTLDTQVHRYPDDTTVYTLSSSVVTIAVSGLYNISWHSGITNGASAAANVTLALRQGGSEVGSTKEANYISAQYATVPFAAAVNIVVAANDTFDLYYTNSQTLGTVASSYTRLDIVRLRSV